MYLKFAFVVAYIFLIVFSGISVSASETEYLTEADQVPGNTLAEQTYIEDSGRFSFTDIDQPKHSLPEKPSATRRILTVGTGVLAGTILGVAAADQAYDCEGENCFATVIFGILLGGAAGGYAGYRLLQNTEPLNAGLRIGIYQPSEWLLETNSHSFHFRFASGLSLGFYVDKKLAEDHYLSPYFNYTSFSTETLASVETNELGLDYNVEHKIHQHLLRSGIGIGYGMAKIEIFEPNLSSILSNYHFYSYRLFSELRFEYFNVELGARAFSHNQIGAIEFKPGLYLGLDFRF